MGFARIVQENQKLQAYDLNELRHGGTMGAIVPDEREDKNLK
jgi:hypothetical protein